MQCASVSCMHSSPSVSTLSSHKRSAVGFLICRVFFGRVISALVEHQRSYGAGCVGQKLDLRIYLGDKETWMSICHTLINRWERRLFGALDGQRIAAHGDGEGKGRSHIVDTGEFLQLFFCNRDGLAFAGQNHWLTHRHV